jgi:hypothetical protein
MKEEFFAPENEVPGSRREHLSPSGHYKLVVSSFSTKAGSWNYAQGLVLRRRPDPGGAKLEIKLVVDEPVWDVVATVQRNYSAFPFLFVEDHPMGDFLVCGHDYQGQTVVYLRTGARKDVLSPGTEDGFGFCWSEYRYDPRSEILVVCGCHWACPYEFRLYDFSDPMAGWPEITIEGDDGSPLGGIGMFEDARWPTLAEDGTIRFYQTGDEGDDANGNDHAAQLLPAHATSDAGVLAHTTFRRKGATQLVPLGEWVSDKEKQHRAAREEAERKFEAWREEFKKSDPLYLVCERLASDPALSPEEHMSLGWVYDGWCPDYRSEGEKERRACRRIVQRPGDKGLTIVLEWAVDAGPIKLVVFRDGDHALDQFFEHSAAGMEEAFARAKDLVRGAA